MQLEREKKREGGRLAESVTVWLLAALYMLLCYLADRHRNNHTHTHTSWGLPEAQTDTLTWTASLKVLTTF